MKYKKISIEQLEKLKRVLNDFSLGKKVYSDDGLEMSLHYTVGIVCGMIKHSNTINGDD